MEMQRQRASVTLVIPLIGVAVFLSACASQGVTRKQHLEFNAFTVEDGLYRPKPGWTFTQGKDNTIVAARANDSIVITPCECALETGGTCSQASLDGPNGDIREVWCVDDGCGFCVGGAVDPDDPSSSVRFDVVCLKNRRVARPD